MSDSFDLMRTDHAYRLIIDLEATCNDDGSLPRDEMEIIEIGALMQDAQTFEVVSEFQTFVRPVRNPELTEFCVRLTTIAQTQVATAPRYPEAIGSLRSWMRTFDDAVFCSWGVYDRRQFEKDCAYHGVEYPFPPEHINLKEEFSRVLNTGRRFGLSGALKRLGLEFEGTPHRGIDDVRNIARIVRALMSAQSG